MGRILTTFLEVDGVVKRFGQTTALDGINLNIARGETVALLGPSGSGKSTLLRVISGLVDPDEGEVRLQGRSLSSTLVSDRGFGLMFQDLALFPHLNVFDNIAFGLRMQRWEAGDSGARVRELAALVRIGHLLQRRTDELSGGEQQRVALARSLAPRPSVLMLDEPLGSLDRTLRDDLINEIRAVLRDEQVTALYVTHDQDEAFAVADRVAVVNNGRVAQMGPAADVYYGPASPFIARFLGHQNLIDAMVVGVKGRAATVETGLGRWELPLAPSWSSESEVRTLLLPIDAVGVKSHAEPDSLPVSVEDAVMRAGRYVVSVRTVDSGFTLSGVAAAVSGGWVPVRGDRAWVTINVETARLLPWRRE